MGRDQDRIGLDQRRGVVGLYRLAGTGPFFGFLVEVLAYGLAVYETVCAKCYKSVSTPSTSHTVNASSENDLFALNLMSRMGWFTLYVVPGRNSREG